MPIPGDQVKIRDSAIYGHFSGRTGKVTTFPDSSGRFRVAFEWPGGNKIMAFAGEDSSRFTDADVLDLPRVAERPS